MQCMFVRKICICYLLSVHFSFMKMHVYFELIYLDDVELVHYLFKFPISLNLKKKRVVIVGRNVQS